MDPDDAYHDAQMNKEETFKRWMDESIQRELDGTW